jgi:hypothetical protein
MTWVDLADTDPPNPQPATASSNSSLPRLVLDITVLNDLC